MMFHSVTFYTKSNQKCWDNLIPIDSNPIQITTGTGCPRPQRLYNHLQVTRGKMKSGFTPDNLLSDHYLRTV